MSSSWTAELMPPPPTSPGELASTTSAATGSLGQQRELHDIRHNVGFLHPGLNDGFNCFLTMLGCDKTSGRGIHSTTASVACGIVTGNHWNGWFQETRDGPPIRPADDRVLTDKRYYFFLPGFDNTPGAATPYSLPTSYYPETPASQRTNKVLLRDRLCRMAGWASGSQAAHVIPAEEEEWFLRNHMYDYNGLRQNHTNDIRNSLLLRADLHVCFGQRIFAFVPKPVPNNLRQRSLVTHLLSPSDDVEPIFHGTQLRQLTDVSVEFLFARFAWSIFPRLNGFLTLPLKLPIAVDVEPRQQVRFTDLRTRKERGYLSVSSPSSGRKRRRVDADEDSAGDSRLSNSVTPETESENDDEEAPSFPYSEAISSTTKASAEAAVLKERQTVEESGLLPANET